ncbi:sensor histidine kinase [Terrisporobacter sp.]|uniref:sensor histidine kinase n=1 Tax=Terrisporobacter sp. TaxID=1965305 RepID=UPI002629B7AA|nr:ATP-binding protein [Terrisporobacter sp.]
MNSIFNKFDEYVLITNSNGDIVFANDKFLKKLKYNEEEIYELNVEDILVDKDNYKTNILEVSADTRIDISFYSKNNKIIQLFSDISIGYFEKNKAIFIISKDIKYKYYSIEDLEVLLDNMGLVAFLRDKDGKYLYVNNTYSSMHSKKSEELLGTYMKDFFDKDLVTQYIKNDKEVLKLNFAKSYNEKGIYFDEEVWHDIYKHPIYDENGNYKYMVCVAKNVTLEKAITEELYKNYNRITNLNNIGKNRNNNIDMHSLLEDIGHKITKSIEASGFSILLYDAEKQSLIPYVKIKNAIKIFSGIESIPIKSNKEYDYMVNKSYEGLRLVERPLDQYYVNEKSLENTVYTASYKIKLYDEFIGILNISYDDVTNPPKFQDDFMKFICDNIAMIIKSCRLSKVTKLESKKRKDTEYELELYLKTAVDLFATFDELGYIKKVNSNWTKLLGWSEYELVNHNYVEFVYPEDLNIIVEIKDMLDCSCRLINRYMCKNGGYRWLEWNYMYDSVNNIVIGTAKDITEQKNIEEQRKSLEEKVSSEIVKNEFFANISHEFKTPLNIILGTTQLAKKNMENDNFSRGSVTKHIDTIKQNSYRLLRLVNNFIDISKIDIGYYNMQFSNHNIINIIEDITLSVVDYVEDKNINLIFDTDVEEVILSCDPDKIERVMLNLLSNAIKYTSDNGSIEVNITSDSKEVKVSVKDTGTGIPPDKLEIIFDRFGQANTPLSRRFEGSGIGLSLVKSIVEKHGGNIKVYSDVGKGTNFVFNIPIKVLDEEDENIINCNNKDFHIEKCQIEFSDIYSL